MRRLGPIGVLCRWAKEGELHEAMREIKNRLTFRKDQCVCVV